MYMKRILSFFLILILLFEFFFFINVSANENNIDLIINTLNNEIGKENTTAMFEDFKEEILKIKEISNEEIIVVINSVSEKYGVIFTEEQLNILIDYYEQLLEDEKGILNNFINLLKNFWNWIKSLHSNSKVEITPNTSEDNSLIEAEDDIITINIPTVEEVDTFMDKIIYNIKNYIFQNNTNE